MATHRFQPTHYHTTIGSHEPVLHIADGDTLTSSQSRGTWDSCLAAFSLLPGRATRPWGRLFWWPHERGDGHGSQLPGRSPYTSLLRHPLPIFQGREWHPATSGIDFTHRPSRWNPPNLWFLLRCRLLVAQTMAVVNCGLKPLKHGRVSQGQGAWACAPKGSLFVRRGTGVRTIPVSFLAGCCARRSADTPPCKRGLRSPLERRFLGGLLWSYTS
jgi:hypothetical protein